MQPPPFTPAATLQLVVNGKSGSSDADAKRDAIESGLRDAGRAGTIHFAGPGELERMAREGAAKALADGSAVIAVGGDGTINTVAQAAHAAGCAMGVLPEGTFNYFAREHGVPDETDEALRWLLEARPTPTQVSAINERIFLVNASVGLYPDLLQDRERWKSRFGRSRTVALGAALSTLLRAQGAFRLLVEADGETLREVRTLTLFVGNNRLQLEQLGLIDEGSQAQGSAADGLVTAVILKPIGTLRMLGLVVRGAMGQLGDAGGVEHFTCQKLTVAPTFTLAPNYTLSRRRVKVAFDGEVRWMTSPLAIRVLPTPLWLLKGRASEPARERRNQSPHEDARA